MTDRDKGFQDGRGDALLRIKRVSFGPYAKSQDYASGYRDGQKAGLQERQSFDSVISNPQPGRAK